MNYRDTIRLVTEASGVIESRRYWGRQQRDQIMVLWANKYLLVQYYIDIRPAIDLKMSVELLKQYPQLKA